MQRLYAMIFQASAVVCRLTFASGRFTFRRIQSGSKEFIVLIEIVEHIRRNVEGLCEHVVADSVQTGGNSDVGGQAIIKCQHQLEVGAADILDGVEPSLRDEADLTWREIEDLLHYFSGVVRSCNPKLGL